MNSKPTILVSENKTVFQSWYLEDLWEKYFNIEVLDINKNYDKHSTVVVSDNEDFYAKTNVNELILANKGIKHIIDHCWDSWDSNLDKSADFTLRPRDFMWINESIWYKHLGYDQSNLKKNSTCDFLLLMNKKNIHRTELYNRLQPILKNNIYSYVGNNIELQNAQDQEYNDANWQRYTDPTWYTSTRFSIVAESQVLSYGPNYYGPGKGKYLELNVTEKTLKPCAFKHPSVIWGQVGTLAWQKRQGFETFDHCIDETYDTVDDEDVRLNKVVEQIHACIADKTIFADPLTQQKLEHNYNHFYNQELVMKLVHEQIINPLLEFIND